MRPLYQSRDTFIAALIDDVEMITAEEIPNAGRAHRRRARKIAETQAKAGITPSMWAERLQGNAAEQEYVAVAFLQAARVALVAALEDMNMR